LKSYYVYMATNKTNSVLYTGVSGALETRVAQHKEKAFNGFSARYNIKKLVYFEETSDVHAAIAREKQIKGWTRKKKNDLVATVNPGWSDLSADWYK
jgi:putative endonuclease